MMLYWRRPTRDDVGKKEDRSNGVRFSSSSITADLSAYPKEEESEARSRIDLTEARMHVVEVLSLFTDSSDVAVQAGVSRSSFTFID
ncbi:hypothetical protein BHE74_00026727 [Ensete ventricosum]|nr:hypothetical protein BHE74_00026727 [Ensete ventricosum]